MKSNIQFITVPKLPASTRKFERILQHSFFLWAGLRPCMAQHTLAEHEVLRRYAQKAYTVVEIGVAEGASAAGIREAMPPDGELYLVDPFHLSRIAILNLARAAAHRTVKSVGNTKTTWIESFSYDAVREWTRPIDFLFIDGDHCEEAVKRDWLAWSPFVTTEGVVAFHDARLFASGWTSADWGPVRFVNECFRENANSGWCVIEEVHSLVLVSRNQSVD